LISTVAGVADPGSVSDFNIRTEVGDPGYNQTSSTAQDRLQIENLQNYEEEHFPIATPDPIEAIRLRMEQAGLQPADLNPYLQCKKYPKTPRRHPHR
jgi:hypothetical protein